MTGPPTTATRRGPETDTTAIGPGPSAYVPDAADVEKRLSPAQRAALVRAHRGQPQPAKSGRTLLALVNKGLIEGGCGSTRVERGLVFLLPLGVLVAELVRGNKQSPL